jgi:hypothetical protein
VRLIGTGPGCLPGPTLKSSECYQVRGAL